jgi:hypothetical protein
MDQRDPNLDPRRDDLRYPPEVRPGVVPALLGIVALIILGFVFFGPARTTDRTVTARDKSEQPTIRNSTLLPRFGGAFCITLSRRNDRATLHQPSG